MPLDFPLGKFGNTPLASPRTLSITAVTIGAFHPDVDSIDDTFAPGQFSQLSDDELLVAPSFEPHHAGVRIAAAQAQVGTASRAPVAALQIVDDPLGPPPPPPTLVILPLHVVTAAAALRDRDQLTFSGPVGPRVRDLEFAAVSAADLSPVTTTTATTFSAVRESIRGRSGVQVVMRAQLPE
jgi:hypothetical protein